MKHFAQIFVASVLVSSLFLSFAEADASSLGDASSVTHPGNALSKVTKMLETLKSRITKDAEREAATYTKLKQWCESSIRTESSEIEYQTPLAEKANANMMKSAAAVKGHQEEIEALAQELATSQVELTKAIESRAKEKADNAKGMQELRESLKDLGDAIAILEKEVKKNPVALTQVDTTTLKRLLQAVDTVVDAASLPVNDKNKLMAFIQSSHKDSNKDSVSDSSESAVDRQLDIQLEAASSFDTHAASDEPKYGKYETRSTDIFNLLNQMKEKAQTRLSSMQEDESKAESAYTSLKSSLEVDVHLKSLNLNSEKEKKSQDLEDHAEAEGEYNKATSDIAHHKKVLKEVSEGCATAEDDNTKSVESTSAELEAVGDAIRELSTAIGAMGGDGGFSKGAATEESAEPASLLQLSGNVDFAKAKVVNIVRKLAKAHHSVALTQLASRIKLMLRYNYGGSDPFVKVKGLITDMITSLEAKIADEMSDHERCDKQMKKAQADMEELGIDIEKLDRLYELSQSKEVSIAESVHELENTMHENTENANDKTAIFNQETRNYALTKKELEEGLKGVRTAISILGTFYGEPPGGASPAASAAALLQQFEKDVADASKPKTTAGQGIIDMLRMIEFDMAKSLALAQKDYEDAKLDYNKVMEEYQLSMVKNKGDVEYLGQKGLKEKDAMAEYSKDEANKKELKKKVAVSYLLLKDHCVTAPGTYDEKKQQRDEEIAGLKEALTILEDETVFFQQVNSEGRKLRGTRHNRYIRVD